MKKSVNVYWALNEGDHLSLPLLAIKPESVIADYAKNNKDSDYIKCPAFSREFKNTFIVRSPYDFIIDIDPQTFTPTSFNNIELLLKSPSTKHVACGMFFSFFSDESLEMSQIPSSLHFNNFVNNTKLFSGKYDIGKWFRPLSLDILLEKPQIKIKKGDILFYLKFHTDKKINFINFRYNEEILKIEQSCFLLKFKQSGFRFKELYNRFIRIGYHKKLLKEIKKNITDLK